MFAICLTTLTLPLKPLNLETLKLKYIINLINQWVVKTVSGFKDSNMSDARALLKAAKAAKAAAAAGGGSIITAKDRLEVRCAWHALLQTQSLVMHAGDEAGEGTSETEGDGSGPCSR